MKVFTVQRGADMIAAWMNNCHNPNYSNFAGIICSRGTNSTKKGKHTWDIQVKYMYAYKDLQLQRILYFNATCSLLKE
ncbi:hypothetical protein DAI22_01g312050 [Oryza sativa Japonica Group]|nr:hypothetical protein DAI22_01g312050 [Oryza sativa Japonica Group]